MDHENWFETKIIDNEEKVIMPWAFHNDFPDKEKVRQIINKMNQDLGCVANYEVTDIGKNRIPKTASKSGGI